MPHDYFYWLIAQANGNREIWVNRGWWAGKRGRRRRKVEERTDWKSLIKYSHTCLSSSFSRRNRPANGGGGWFYRGRGNSVLYWFIHLPKTMLYDLSCCINYGGREFTCFSPERLSQSSCDMDWRGYSHFPRLWWWMVIGRCWIESADQPAVGMRVGRGEISVWVKGWRARDRNKIHLNYSKMEVAIWFKSRQLIISIIDWGEGLIFNLRN